MRKGFLLSLDALVAVSVLLLFAVFMAGIGLTYSYPELNYQRLYLAGKDMMKVMEKVTMEDLQDLQTVQDCIGSGMLGPGDMDKALLDVIGSFWATGNQTYQDYASNLTAEAFNQTIPDKFGYEVLMGGTSIFRKESSSGDASTVSKLSTSKL